MSAVATRTMIHRFEDAGHGKAPFEYLGCTDNGGKTALVPCDYCGTSIRYEYWLKSADGNNFKVGSECIQKSGDAGLIEFVEAEEKARRLAVAAAKRQAAFDAAAAELQAERDRNGGLTDYEVKEANEKAERAAKKLAMAIENAWILDALSCAYPGGFVLSMQSELKDIPASSLSWRCKAILAEIYAKDASNARKGSKKYVAAENEARAKLGMNDDA